MLLEHFTKQLVICLELGKNLLRKDYIFMPTLERALESKVAFMRMSYFPVCIAAVDGTHVSVQSFGGADAEVYRNRKMYFSLNVQLAVSADVISLLFLPQIPYVHRDILYSAFYFNFIHVPFI